MAIHPDFPGLVAEVVVDGKPLREYDDDGQAAPKTVTKYVEVVSDANFGVRCTFPKDFFLCGEHQFKVIVDGVEIEGSAPVRLLGSGILIWCMDRASRRTVNGSYTQKLRFSQLTLGKQW